MKGTDKIVYIAHCIDTEGPLFESTEASFERLKEIFGVDVEASESNLEKIQNQELDLGGVEEEAATTFSPRFLNTNESWTEIENQIDKITKNKFRKKYKDSFGDEWRYSWFLLDHVGFEGGNPRRRALGHHVVFDQYQRWHQNKNMAMDELNWHYHPKSIRSDAHRCATEYVGSKNIFEILARKITDRTWFPAAFRPGFHAERPDSHWFLEQWIPFDFGNQSGKTVAGQPDLAKGRFGDWRRAPTSWIPYNPDHDDYQTRGNCRRYIARCLNMDTRLRNLTCKDVAQAFREAKEQGQSLLAFTDHDHRKMDRHIEKVWNMISEVSEDFEDVKFKHTTAIGGMRAVLGIAEPRPANLHAEIKKINKKEVLIVESENEIFGPQPFLALKTKNQEYVWQNFDRQSSNTWSYTFDFHTLPVDSIDCIGVAANSPDAVTSVLNLYPDRKKIKKRVLNA